MSTAFADTSFYMALLNPRDRHHRDAAELSRHHRVTVTTEFVLLEAANALSGTPLGRNRFLTLTERVQRRQGVTLLPASHDLFARGVDRYRARRDKSWSLTDCISFVIMEERGLTDALTAGRPFEHAGFIVLLKCTATKTRP